MSIAATDLKNYASANMPESDSTTSGGAIATGVVIDDMLLAANDSLKVKSSSASDTAGTTCTVTGRDATGAIVSENHTLNGTSAVTFATTFERILKVVLTGTTTVGVVTVYRSDGITVVVALPIAKTSVRRLFYDSASAAGSTVRYEKIFWKNEHGTLTLTTATLKLTADPAAVIRIAPATAVDDTGSVANRLTLPGGLTFVDDNVSTAVPGNALAAGSAIGVWVEMTLAGGNAAIKNTFTTSLLGNSV
jgi:hypothetical protein